MLVGPPKAGGQAARAGRDLFVPFSQAYLLTKANPFERRGRKASRLTSANHDTTGVRGPCQSSCPDNPLRVAVLIFRTKLQKQGDMAMKENFGVIWTDEIEIEELEPKVAPDAQWAVG